MDTITIPRIEYEQIQEELKVLRRSIVYSRLLEFEKNISKGRKYTRKELGF